MLTRVCEVSNNCFKVDYLPVVAGLLRFASILLLFFITIGTTVAATTAIKAQNQ